MTKNKSRSKLDHGQGPDDSTGGFRIRPRKPRTNAQSEGNVWSIALKTVFRYARSSSRGKRSAGKPYVRRAFSQRCAVRVVYAPNKTAGQWRAHGRYIERESATLDAAAAGFTDKQEAQDAATILARWQAEGDERLWKIIISPEFGDRLDLTQLTRDVMTRMEKDLKTRLEWVAVTHFNTGHPHVHVALRGIRQDGTPVKMERDYIRSGIRRNAEDACTRQLGHRTELDAIAAEEREVGQDRFTSLDRQIAAHSRETQSGSEDSTHFATTMASQSSGSFSGFRQRNVAARLVKLAQMGLAVQVVPGSWKVRRDFDAVLRAMQRVSDHQKMLAARGALLSDDRLPITVVDRRKLDTLEGRVLLHGEDEHGGNAGRHYVMIEGTDAKVHLMYYTPEMEELRSRGRLRTNSFVRLRKLFIDHQPLIDIQDLGDSESILRNKQHLSSTVRNLIKRGIVPTEDGWGGWLGRYQAAVSNAALGREGRRMENKGRNR